MDVDRLIDGMMDTLDGAFGEGAALLAERLDNILNVQADLDPRYSYPRALYRAIPGAPPRRVSGNLQAHIAAGQVGRASWVAGIEKEVDYAVPLETSMGHRYVSVVVEESMGDLTAIVKRHLGAP